MGEEKNKQDFIKFLIYAHSSVDETRDHLEVLFETKSLEDKDKFIEIKSNLDVLARKLYRFIQLVSESHKKIRSVCCVSCLLNHTSCSSASSE